MRGHIYQQWGSYEPPVCLCPQSIVPGAAMSVQAMSWVLDHSELVGVERLVLLAIANACDRDGRHAWPTHDRVAREAMCSERSVHRAVMAASESGELGRVQISRRGRQNRPRFMYWLPAVIEAAGVGPVAEDMAERFALTPDEMSGVESSRHRTSATSTPDEMSGVGLFSASADKARPKDKTKTKALSTKALVLKPEDLNRPKSTRPTRARENPKIAARENPAEFEQFWDAYPRRIAKRKASAIWDRLIKSGVDAVEIISGAARYAEWCEVAHAGEPRFWKHATTWLNGGCWEDQLPNPAAMRTGTKPRTGSSILDAVGRMREAREGGSRDAGGVGTDSRVAGSAIPELSGQGSNGSGVSHGSR